MHLARRARRPRGGASSSSTPSSRTSTGSISRSSGQRARREQLQRGREAVGVVVVRADRGELEHDHPVVVDARQLASRADEHERPRVVELVERGLGRARVTRALERDGERRRRPAVPSARGGARRGRRRAPRRPRARARGGARRRLRHRDVVHAARAQAPRSSAVRPGPPPVTSTRSAGSHAGEVDGVDRDRGRLGQRGGAGRRASSGMRSRRSAGDGHVAAEGAAEGEEVGRLAPETHRRTAAPARPARRRSPESGSATTRAPGSHPATPAPVATTVPAHSWPSTEPGPGVLLEHEVQVGAADPAVRHLDEHVTRPRHGNRELLHLDRAVPDVDGRGHRRFRHRPPVTSGNVPTGREARQPRAPVRQPAAAEIVVTFQSDAYMPSRSSNSSCVPSSTIRPSSRTTMRSAAARGLEAVGDEERRAPGRHDAHRPLHARLGGEVEVRGRLVEEQDRRVDEQRPGQAERAGAGRPTATGRAR